MLEHLHTRLKNRTINIGLSIYTSTSMIKLLLGVNLMDTKVS